MMPLAGSAFLFTHRNATLWIPFLITHGALPRELQPHYTTWLYIELAGHIFSAFGIVLNTFVTLKVNAFHINMKILFFYGIIVLSATNMGTRICLILIELNYLQLSEVADMVVPLMLVKLSAWVGIYNCVIYITIERYAALKYSSDYETNHRVSISITIMAVNSTFACTVAYLLVYNIMNGAVYMLMIFCMSNLSCVAFSRIAMRNIEENKEVTAFRGDYSDFRILMYGIAAQISFYLPIFFLPPLLLENDSSWRSTLELNKAIFQMACSYGFGIAYLFCTLCITRHLEYIKSTFWKGNDTQKISPARTERQTTDDHFESLKNWWDVDSESAVHTARVLRKG